VQLELLEKLADENLAEACLARLTVDGEARLVTARRLQKQVTDVPGVVDALSDASAVMRSIEHENILRHVGFGEAGGGHYWITERTDGFDLATAINRLSSREVHISPVRSLQIGLDFLQGLQHLHRQELLHGGVSPGYVLVGYDGVARLDGIGFESPLRGIKDLKQKARRLRSDYLAPEVVQGRDPAPQSDVFSAAAILYTLLTGNPPMEKEGSGAGMSVRHSTIELPSKLDRTLPFSCDAIFLKALNVSPRQRHESIDSFTAAIKRLRAAMLKGADEGRLGVKDFVENLFPNEAIVAGKPGSIDKPAMGEGVRLTMLLGRPGPAGRTAPSAPVVPEPEAAEVTEPPAESKADDEALARVAAWEAAFGKTGKGEDKKPGRAEPPPLRGRPVPSRPPPVPADKKETPGPTSVVVDWMELGVEKESEDTRSGTEPVLEEPAAFEPPPVPPVSEPVEPEEEEPTPIRMEKIPTLVVERDEEEQTEPEKPAGEVLDGEPAGFDGELPPVHDTVEIPQAAEPEPEPEPPGDLPAARKKSPWRIVAILVVVVVAAVLAIAFWPRGDGEAQGGAEASPVAFLSVHADRSARVTLDGELLEGVTPVKDKVLRAGKHRVMVDDLDGVRLMDEVILLEAGEHKDIRLVIAAAPALAESPDAGIHPDKPTGKKIWKKRVKKHVRKKRRKTRK
jgi:hypothetical protein